MMRWNEYGNFCNLLSIGSSYYLLSVFSGITGLVISSVFRTNCLASISYSEAHDLILIFLFIMTFLISHSWNSLYSSAFCLSEISLISLNSISLILFVLGLCLFMAHTTSAGTTADWTFYVTLSNISNITSVGSLTSILVALLVLGTSSTFSSVNFLALNFDPRFLFFHFTFFLFQTKLYCVPPVFISILLSFLFLP